MSLNPNYLQRFAVAPMLDWTTRYCRAFHRQLSKHAVLYTEMVATSTVIHSKNDHLFFRPEWEGDVILQLGGSDPKQMAEVAAKIQANKDKYPYVGINLNVGCPSPRVQSGSFGAVLMNDPELVADCMIALKDNCDLPLSVKTRIGVDELDSFEFLESFILPIIDVGIDDFVLHARKAYLNGLSPKENREVPPLNYQRVFDLKGEYPELNICINGGITSLTQAHELLQQVDGVMLGREAYSNPVVLTGVDAILFDDLQNSFAKLTGKFDPTLTGDKSFSLYPDQFVIEDKGYAFNTKLKMSIFSGFNILYKNEPFLKETELLIQEIHEHNIHRRKQGISEARTWYLEEHPIAVPKHQPKSEITATARFTRLQKIAATESMFIAFEKLRPFWESEIKNGTDLPHLFKPILGAFNGIPGARSFRRYFSDHGFKPGANIDVIYYALDMIYDKFIQYVKSSF